MNMIEKIMSDEISKGNAPKNPDEFYNRRIAGNSHVVFPEGTSQLEIEKFKEDLIKQDKLDCKIAFDRLVLNRQT